MNADEKEEARLINEIRKLSGKLGILGGHDLPQAPDAEEYDHQVHVGLAIAVSDIMEHHFGKVMFWLGRSIIHCGGDPDDRISALMDALTREVEDQIDSSEEDDCAGA